mmetsp:Transcript_7470/g.8658  ORF Transcript_7470/g.8658 Transcript_7470/m.8658 type:complete len:134 (+) Transcript_7470:3-404(+)
MKEIDDAILESQTKLETFKKTQAFVLNRTNTYQRMLYNHRHKHMTQSRSADDIDSVEDGRDKVNKDIEQLQKVEEKLEIMILQIAQTCEHIKCLKEKREHINNMRHDFQAYLLAANDVKELEEGTDELPGDEV